MAKKFKFLILISCFFFIASLIFGADVELLTNPGFESGTTGWAGRSCTLTATTAQKRSGSYSGVGTNRKSTWMGVKQSLLGKMTAGATYNVSGWVRVSSASDSVKLSVEQGDGKGTAYIDIATGTATNTGWLRLAGTFTLTVTGALTVLDVYFEGPAAGVDLYVDDASVFGPGLSTNVTGIVNTAVRHQVIEGFGAAGGWYENYLTNHPQKAALYDLLFKQLSLDIYRYRNTYQIDSVYLDRTAQLIAAARAVRPNLKLMVASWSPPASLKSNNNTREGTLKKNSSGQYMYTEYAQWWADSLANFATRGITPDYVSMQNEPDYTNSGWDTCVFAPTETTALAGFDKAFRAFYAKTGSLKLIAPDSTGFGSSKAFIDALTPVDKSHLYAYAHHLYSDIWLSDMAAYATAYGDKPRFQTEFSAYATDGASTFEDALKMAQVIDNTMTAESAAVYLYWELFWVGRSGFISLESSTYTIRPVYYAFKQFSGFTDPGWQRIDASTNSLSLKVSAYISPDNKQLSVVIINSSTTALALDLANISGFSPSNGTIYRTSAMENCQNVGSFNPAVAMSLPAQSITTIAFTGTIQSGGIKGDVNGDLLVNIVDALLVAQFSAGLNLPSFIAGNADVNCDGAITIVDAFLIAQFSAGLIHVFPCL